MLSYEYLELKGEIERLETSMGRLKGKVEGQHPVVIPQPDATVEWAVKKAGATNFVLMGNAATDVSTSSSAGGSKKASRDSRSGVNQNPL